MRSTSMTQRTDSTLNESQTAEARHSKHWQDASKLLFERPISSDPASGRRRRQKHNRLELFVKSLRRSTLQGDTQAIRQTNRLRSHLERKDILDAPAEPTRGQRDMRKAIAEQAALAKVTAPYLSLAYVTVHCQLRDEHLERYGTPLVTQYTPPEYIDPSIAVELLLKARRQKSTEGTTSEVGYGRPPVAQRWVKSQSGNPAGRSKQVDDGWAAFRTSLGETVSVRINGERVSLSSDEVTVLRLLEQACQGKRAAQRSVCDLLIELDRRHLLTPPPPRKRRKSAKALSPELLSWCAKAQRIAYEICVLNVKRWRAEDFAVVFGTDPAFDSNIDREMTEVLGRLRQALLEREGIK